MANTHLDSFNCEQHLDVNGKTYHYYSLSQATENGLPDISSLPFSLKVLLENLLRTEDGLAVNKQDIDAVAAWLKQRKSSEEIAYTPARVLMQDFTGVPAVVDLAAMRDAVAKNGGNPEVINPLSPVDLVIDHSVMVDNFGNPNAFEQNVDTEMQRNAERYQFLRWGQNAFKNFRVVPPGTGICHQVNLEYLAKVVWTKEVGGKTIAYPDTLVGTDSHTTMVNGLGVLGWGVGGIEAEAAMLGQPISMLIPEVIGFKLTGQLQEGITATDLVLKIVQMLREKGVVGKFVEFYGPALNVLPLADRATIANMAPEYGATCGFFPVDRETIKYLELTGRGEEAALVEAYTKAQGMWRDNDAADPVFTDSLELDISTVKASVAGPKRPQDRVELTELKSAFDAFLADSDQPVDRSAKAEGTDFDVKQGDVVIAAITSCTNTSNPSVMMAAGLVAKNAIAKGLKVKPWVKTSLAPGSKVVSDYLKTAGLQDDLDRLGFNLVGYGCTTCIGNSGPLPEPIEAAIKDADLVVSSVLSGNRNFEGRVHPLVKTNWLASPPLVVAYAIAGTTRIDITSEPIAQDADGNDVYLKDIWPSNHDIAEAVAKVSSNMFDKEYAAVFDGDQHWQSIEVPESQTYHWDNKSTYVQNPPFFAANDTNTQGQPIRSARILALLGDSITTDHISPAGAIKADSPAGQYLQSEGVDPKDFNSYGSRRGNHEVMMRGTFANIRIRNEMLDDVEGGYTKHVPTGEQMSIYDAAMKYQSENTPLVVIAGKEYGTGSSRDWAAKGTRLLGVKAVIAESFERIHRSNLIGMGVLPLQFQSGDSRTSLHLTGNEIITVDVSEPVTPQADIAVTIEYADGSKKDITVLSRIDTANEVHYYLSCGILHYVLNNLAA